MNCNYLKTMTKKCIKLNKKITYKDCINCEFKEYKIEKKLKNEKKLTISAKKSYKNIKKSTKMRNKSCKLAKLERNRWSVFTDDLDVCILCGKPREHLHEVFEGSNRKNSMKYGFVLPLNNECHRKIHSDRPTSLYYKKLSQIYFEKYYGSRNDFISTFKRNYLDK